MLTLRNEDKKYFQDVWQKIDNKLQKVAVRSLDKLPYTTIDGIHDHRENTSWWTNGFWPGLMWVMYMGTKNEQYSKTAVSGQNLLRKAFTNDTENLHHDAGFMWNISSGVNYRINGDKQAFRDVLLAASLLASRFNIKGGYIRAWNYWGNDPEKDNKGWTIIDCMMNLPLLYRATDITKDERFTDIAKAHADKTMAHHVREDGSVRHIVKYDHRTGAYLCDFGGQGYGQGSSWSRGQAWGLYGFVLSYLHTKDEKYLTTAKKIADYFIGCLEQDPDFLPLCDFRAPATPVIYDSTAGCCAAAGLIELANLAEGDEKSFYLDAAIRLLKAMTEKFVDFSEDTDALVLYGTEAYHKEETRHIPIIYGDYFYAESIYKLISEKNDDMLFW